MRSYTVTVVYAVVCGAHSMEPDDLKKYVSRERKITMGRVTDAAVLVALARPDPEIEVPLNQFIPYRAWVVNGVHPGVERYRAGTRARNRCVTFELGDEVPLLPEFLDVPKIRYGMSVSTRKIRI